jgi:hypothetical protein
LTSLAALGVSVGDDAEDLVALLLHSQGLKGQGNLPLHPGKLRLTQELAGGDIPVDRVFFAMADRSGDKADLGPFFAGLYHLPLYLFRHRPPVLHVGNRFLELFRHIGADGELDPAEAAMVCLFAVPEEIVLVACGIGTEVHVLHSFREHIERLLEHPELFKACGHVPVPELGVEHKFLFRPPDIERLIGSVALVTEQGICFLCCHERGVRIERRVWRGMAFLDGCNKVPVYPRESGKVLIGRRDEGFALFAFLLLTRIVEGFKIPEYRGRGRNGTMLLLAPSSFHGSPLLAGPSLRLHPVEHLREAFIPFEYFEVIHIVSPGQVEQDKREDHLFIGPSLGLHVHMGADMISQAEDRGEVEIDGETGEGGHAACLLLLFVLVGKDALWHTVFTSLVIGWFRSLILSSLVSRANGVFNYFDGESGIPASVLRTPPISLAISLRLGYVRDDQENAGHDGRDHRGRG